MTKAKWQMLWETALIWSSDPVTRKRVALQRAERRGMARMMDPLQRALAEADAQGIQFYGNHLAEYLQVLKTVAPVFADLSSSMPFEPIPRLPQLPLAPALPTYIVSPATLAEAYAYLTQQRPDEGQEPEWMLAVTGVQHNDLRTLEHLIQIKLAQQSAVTATFDMQDFARVAITLHEQGLALHAIFHSHRFRGQPQPSMVDWRLQEVLDQGGYPAIQAVFSEDGYVRFFAQRPFAVRVSGKGVDCVDQETALYRLTHFGLLPHPRRFLPADGSGDGIRPLFTHSGR